MNRSDIMRDGAACNRSDCMRIAVRKFDPFERAIADTWADFVRESGCPLVLQAVPMDLHPLYDATLGNGGLTAGEWDIAHMNTDWIAEAYRSGAIAPLNALLDAAPPAEYPDGWSASLQGVQNFDGTVVGLPFHDGPECLIYRKDLFDDPTERATFQSAHRRPLSVPETWEEFLTVARFFHRPERGLSGTIVAGYPDGHNTVFDFCLQVWTHGGRLSDSRGRIRIDHDEAATALSFYRALLGDTSCIHPEARTSDSVAAGMAFARGEVAMMVNWFGFASMCEVIPESTVAGCVDIAGVPKGTGGRSVSLNAYWLFTLPSGSVHKEWAYRFISYATDRRNDKRLTLAGGIGCRRSTWRDRDINAAIPYFHRLEELHAIAETLPRKPHWAHIAAIIDGLMLTAMNTDDDLRAALVDAQHKIDAVEERYDG